MMPSALKHGMAIRRLSMPSVTCDAAFGLIQNVGRPAARAPWQTSCARVGAGGGLCDSGCAEVHQSMIIQRRKGSFSLIAGAFVHYFCAASRSFPSESACSNSASLPETPLRSRRLGCGVGEASRRAARQGQYHRGGLGRSGGVWPGLSECAAVLNGVHGPTGQGTGLGRQGVEKGLLCGGHHTKPRCLDTT